MDQSTGHPEPTEGSDRSRTLGRHATLERLLAIVDLLPDATLVLDAGRRVVAWNRAMEEMTGVPRAGMVGKGDYAYAVPLYGERRPILVDLIWDDELAAERYEYVRREGDVFYFETFVSALRGGRGAYLWGKSAPLRDHRGRLIGAIEVIRDITDRRLEADELMRSQQMLRTVLDTVPHSVYWKDRGSVYVGANRAFAHDAGFDDPDELVGRTDEDMAWGIDAEAYRARDVEVMESGEPRLGYEEPIRLRDGTVRWKRASKVPLHDRQGEVIGVLGAYEDITSRRRAEEALRESEERYRRLVESTTDYIYTVHIEDGRPTRTEHGEGCVAVTGYTRDEFAADPYLWVRMIVPDDRDSVVARADAVTSGERSQVLEHRIVRKDGAIRWVRNTQVARTDEHGRVVGYDGLVSDITERRQLQEQLRQAQKMEAVGQLAGGIAHDFNNLLTAIRGYTELITTDLPAGSPSLEDLAHVLRATDQAAALTRKLLAFSRRQALVAEVIDAGDAVRRLAPIVGRLLGEHIVVDASRTRSAGHVKVDPGQLEQVVMNLAVNARDAMPSGGRLTVETQDVDLDDTYAATHADATAGPYVMLSVSDTGSGMDAETQARAFEPFFTTKELGQGTGMGLATVYGIVRQSGGFVHLYSEPGRGTVVRIYLPRVSEPLTEWEAMGSSLDVPSGTETVLLVEDDAAVRRFASRVLSELGYAVVEASTGSEALELANRNGASIEILVTDLVMPAMGGRELADHLRTHRPSLPVVYMSGFAEGQFGPAGLVPADVAYLTKPFTAGALADAVRRALDAPTP